MIEINDKVDFIGTLKDLEDIYLEDVSKKDLINMTVVAIDNYTYDEGLTISTNAGFVFPENLLKKVL
jgi:hypothetical protein